METFDAFTFKLAYGKHSSPQAGTCFMEAVAWMARQPHSDKPKCACPVLGRFGIALNDRMTDEERRALNPLILKMMNTRSKAHEELRAAYLLRGVAVCIIAPLFDERGWNEGAAMLRAIPEGATRAEMVAPLRAVRDYAWKKRAAAAAAYAAAAADAADAADADAADADAADAAAADAATAAAAAADAYAAAAADAATAAAADADAADAAAAYAADAAAAAAYAAAAATAAAAAAYAAAAADAKRKFRGLWARESVALLDEAIQLGPHNADELYEIARVVEFREKVLAGV